MFGIPNATLTVPKTIINEAIKKGLATCNEISRLAGPKNPFEDVQFIFTPVTSDLYVIGIFNYFFQKEVELENKIDASSIIARLFTEPILDAILDINPKVMKPAYNALLDEIKKGPTPC